MPEKKEKRRTPVAYRVPKHLEAEFDRRVAESGQSKNAFLTESWYGRNRHRPAEKQELARLVAIAAQIRDQFNENAGSAGGDNAALIEEAHRQLTEIRNAVMLIAGHKP